MNYENVYIITSAILGLHLLCRVLIPEANKDTTNVERFTASAENSVFQADTSNLGNGLLPPPAIQETTYLINLKRRPDRLAMFRRDFSKCDIPHNFRVVEGVDGGKLNVDKQDLTELARAELKQLETTGYRSKHYQLTRGAIGCYLSHIRAWNQILKDGSNIGLVFEDDANIPIGVQGSINEAMRNAPPDWDIVLMGVACHTCNGVRTRPGFLRVKKFWLLHCYLIKASAIQKIFKSDALFPIGQQIDSLLSEMSDMLKIYAVSPGFVNQRASRTDIQAPLKEERGEDPLARVPIGTQASNSQSITTKITNSLLPSTYTKNGGAASMPNPADLNVDDEDEGNDLAANPDSRVGVSSTTNYT